MWYIFVWQFVCEAFHVRKMMIFVVVVVIHTWQPNTHSDAIFAFYIWKMCLAAREIISSSHDNICSLKISHKVIRIIFTTSNKIIHTKKWSRINIIKNVFAIWIPEKTKNEQNTTHFLLKYIKKIMKYKNTDTF